MDNISRAVTLVVTNAIKVAGLYVGVVAVKHSPPEATVLGFAAFMMAGAQLSETVVITLIERFFGAGDREKK